MGMSGAELMRRPIRAAEGNGNIELSARHREHVWRVVHNLIERNERKTERHELNNRPQPDHCRSDPQAGKSVLTDWSIDDPSWPKALKQTVAYLVSALVFGNLFAHEKNV